MQAITSEHLDQYYNASCGPGVTLTVGDDSEMTSVSYPSVLRKWMKIVDSPLLCLYHPTITAQNTTPNLYQSNLAPDTIQIQILFGRGNFTFKKHKYHYFVLVKGDKVGMVDVRRSFKIHQQPLIFHPEAIWEAVPKPRTLTIKDRGPFNAGILVYVVTIEELPALFVEPNISPLSKVLSAYLLMFPQTTQLINGNCDVRTYSPPVVPNVILGKDEIMAQRISSLILILSPAFTRETSLSDQLGRRGAAAAALSGYPVITGAMVKKFMRTANWTKIDVTPLLSQVIGVAVAVNKDGVSDPDTTIPNLMDVSAVSSKWGLSNWGQALYVQTRLVFENFHATSIRFGFNVLPVARDIIVRLGGRWAVEVESLESIGDLITHAPYMGCRNTIPACHMVATMPRVVYIGVLYHNRNLVTKAVEDEFSHYAIKRITKHINPLSDQHICMMIADNLPLNPVKATATLLTH